MKKVLLAAILFIGSVSLSQAQQQAQRSPAERAERLSQRLKLSTEQKTQLEAIFTAQSKSVDSLRATMSNANRSEMAGKMAPIREAADKKVQAVLNDEQRKAFVAYQEEMRNRGGQGQRGQGEGRRSSN